MSVNVITNISMSPIFCLWEALENNTEIFYFLLSIMPSTLMCSITMFL